MPKTNEMRSIKPISTTDVPSPVLYTIKDVQQLNVAGSGKPAEVKWCLLFEESERPLVLGQVNLQLAEQAMGSGDTDDWIGRKLVLYTDPNVLFAGRLVGGVRVRAPKHSSTSTTRPKQRPTAREELADSGELPEEPPF